MKRLRILIVVVLPLLFGCGPKRPPLYNYPPPPTAEKYEAVWVNPQVVTADSLITLIRADRIDSVLVGPGERGHGRAAAVAFEVVKRDCSVAVTLTDDRQQVIRPLLVQRLEPGLYRLTLNTALKSLPLSFGQTYHLKADVCGRWVVWSFVGP